MIFGDAAIAAPVQFPHPEARVIFDIDPALAAETQARSFDMAATDGLLVAGNQAPFPAFGRDVVRSGEG